MLRITASGLFRNCSHTCNVCSQPSQKTFLVLLASKQQWDLRYEPAVFCGLSFVP